MDDKNTIPLYRWPVAKALQMLAEQLVVNPPDARQRKQAAKALNQIAESLMGLLTPQSPTERIHARLMREACADMLLDRLIKTRKGEYGARSRLEMESQIQVLELMLARMGYPTGCEWRVRQTSDATRVEYPDVLESHQS